MSRTQSGVERTGSRPRLATRDDPANPVRSSPRADPGAAHKRGSERRGDLAKVVDAVEVVGVLDAHAHPQVVGHSSLSAIFGSRVDRFVSTW